MNRRKALKLGGALIFVVAVALAATVLTQVGQRPPQAHVQLAEVRPTDFDIEVHTIGVLDAARSHTVSSGVRGDKGKIIQLVGDGARVARGDLLIRLDATPFEEEARRLRAEVQSFRSAVDAAAQIVEWEKNQAEREIRTAEYHLRVAELEIDRLVRGEGPIQLSRYRTEMENAREERDQYAAYIEDLRNLESEGFSSAAEVSQARKKIKELQEKLRSAESKYKSYKDHVLPAMTEAAKAKVEKARMELEQIRKGSVFKIAKAVSRLEETRGKLGTAAAALRQTESEIAQTIIRAPFGGIVIHAEAFREGQQRKPRVGDQVWQNQPLLNLPDISKMIVKTRIREIDLHKIFLGQSCTVTVDAYPDTAYEGEVSFIGVLASERFESGVGEKYFQLSVALKTEDPRLRPGMTARVTVIGERLRRILAVPVQAVFSLGEGKFCYRFGGQGFHKREVILGRHNEDVVEILSGLSAGDRVSLVEPDPDALL
jgi:HlyD family secretion protein